MNGGFLSCKFLFLLSIIFLTSLFLFGKYLKFFLKSPNCPPSPESHLLVEKVTLDIDKNYSPLSRKENCTLATCFNVYRCGHYRDGLSVYVYPLRSYKDKNGTLLTPIWSKEFLELRNTIITSKYYEPDPQKACLLLPNVDLLNQNRLRLDATGKVLANHEWWQNTGSNHLLFNMFSGSVPDFNNTLDVNTGHAIVAGASYSLSSYRRTLDVSIPIWNPLAHNYSSNLDSKIKYLLVAAQPFVRESYKKTLKQIRSFTKEPMVILDQCKGELAYDFGTLCDELQVHYSYPGILEQADFCLVLEGSRKGQTALSDALQTGCIPVIVSDDYILPFSEVLDWKRASIQLYKRQLPNIIEILTSYSDIQIKSMKLQTKHFWKNYFKNMTTITLTTLKIIQDRLWSDKATTYEQWNEPDSGRLGTKGPLYLERTAPNEGFTAAILTYDRLQLLHKAIKNLANAKSLAKIVVVWNNPNTTPPDVKDWPKIGKKIHVVRTKANKLTNRFVPYDVIETEAVFSLDDDIAMLNADEIEFAYQVWREFPNYLVGFPSRVHVFDSESQKFVYNAEWTNNVSMILTGAAFYHKYYGKVFMEKTPKEVFDLIDRKMNCEDIAMNFLIANITGQPAIKVTPRKRFVAKGSLGISWDNNHLQERSKCMEVFSYYFNGMPLKSVDFRADPVQYKMNNVPELMLQYPKIGSV